MFFHSSAFEAKRAAYNEPRKNLCSPAPGIWMLRGGPAGPCFLHGDAQTVIDCSCDKNLLHTAQKHEKKESIAKL